MRRLSIVPSKASEGVSGSGTCDEWIAFCRPPDLGFAYLGRTNSTKTDLSNVTPSGANLIGANLGEADLSFAYLSGASLMDSDVPATAGVRKVEIRPECLADKYLV
jgi:hypothetical protein